MQSIRTNSDGTVSMNVHDARQDEDRHRGPRDPLHALRRAPHTRLRAARSFDALKKTAITQLGAGRNAKLQLQFDSRFWNAQGSNGNVYSDLGIQNAWDVTRGQAGATGILVDYSGGNIAGGFNPSTPYSNAATNPQVTTYAKQFLTKLEIVFPGITKQWNGKASLSTPFLDPLLNCSYSYWRVGQYTAFAGYEGVAQGNIHFAGEHTSQDFQGFMEGGAEEGARAAKEVLALV